jgi:hypothetical protein
MSGESPAKAAQRQGGSDFCMGEPKIVFAAALA